MNFVLPFGQPTMVFGAITSYKKLIKPSECNKTPITTK